MLAELLVYVDAMLEEWYTFEEAAARVETVRVFVLMLERSDYDRSEHGITQRLLRRDEFEFSVRRYPWAPQGKLVVVKPGPMFAVGWQAHAVDDKGQELQVVVVSAIAM